MTTKQALEAIASVLSNANPTDYETYKLLLARGHCDIVTKAYCELVARSAYDAGFHECRMKMYDALQSVCDKIIAEQDVAAETAKQKGRERKDTNDD